MTDTSGIIVTRTGLLAGTAGGPIEVLIPDSATLAQGAGVYGVNLQTNDGRRLETDRPDFYLASSEGYSMEEPRKAWRMKRLRGEHRDDLLLIRIVPPLVGQKYGLGAQDVPELIVATRHEGASLFPIQRWPVFVHVARPLIAVPASRDIIHCGEMAEIAWAALYPTESAARTKPV